MKDCNAVALKRSLCLIWLLDCLKVDKFLATNPQLFQTEAEHKVGQENCSVWISHFLSPSHPKPY